MVLNNVHSIYFLGIGGIGMSALARFFLLHGKQVYGYDLTETEITAQLTKEGAQIHFSEDVPKIPTHVDVAIYTPAISKEHKEYLYFIEKNIPLIKRSEALGMICNDYPTIAVAGTHGKTTTTALITQMLKTENRKWNVKSGETEENSLKILSFIGGISKNLNSNFVCEKDFNTVIAEADEFDRSFLTLHPQVAIITSIDADHLDIYGNREHLKKSFQLFANQIQPNGALVIFDEIENQTIFPNKILYGFSEKAQYQITNIQYYARKTTFDLQINTPSRASLISSKKIERGIHFSLNIPGKHNALNAVAALAASIEFFAWKNNGNVEYWFIENMLERVSEFAGVKRRFDIRIQSDDFVYIDDYAHHPEEIKAFLEAVKGSYPDKIITGIFQPHLYSRTRDFAQEFAEALEVLDEIILLDIYPAREKAIPGITSDFLLSLIKNKNKKLLTKEKLLSYLQKNKQEVLLTLGAGDIDSMVGKIEMLKKNI